MENTAKGTLFKPRHDRYCSGVCRAQELGVQYAQEKDGAWVAYFAHDGRDEDGNSSLSFQVLLEAATESMLRSSISKAGL